MNFWCKKKKTYSHNHCWYSMCWPSISTWGYNPIAFFLQFLPRWLCNPPWSSHPLWRCAWSDSPFLLRRGSWHIQGLGSLSNWQEDMHVVLATSLQYFNIEVLQTYWADQALSISTSMTQIERYLTLIIRSEMRAFSKVEILMFFDKRAH
jgi:hypothetical protein